MNLRPTLLILPKKIHDELDRTQPEWKEIMREYGGEVLDAIKEPK